MCFFRFRRYWTNKTPSSLKFFYKRVNFDSKNNDKTFLPNKQNKIFTSNRKYIDWLCYKKKERKIENILHKFWIHMRIWELITCANHAFNFFNKHALNHRHKNVPQTRREQKPRNRNIKLFPVSVMHALNIQYSERAIWISVYLF